MDETDATVDQPASPAAPEPASEAAPVGEPAGDVYQVLARKYRPTDFSNLISQEAMAGFSPMNHSGSRSGAME